MTHNISVVDDANKNSFPIPQILGGSAISGAKCVHPYQMIV